MIQKKHIKNIVLVIIIFTVLITGVVNYLDPVALAEMSSDIRWDYLPALLLTLGSFWLFHFLSIHKVLRMHSNEVSTFDSFNISMSVHFYNGITPFSSGGQPFQIYYYSKRGLSIENSSSIIIMNLIIYQVVILFISIPAILFFWSELASNVSNLRYIVIVGFIANSSVFLFLVGLLRSKRLKAFIFNGVYKQIKRISFLRDRITKLEKSTHKYLDDFHDVVERLDGKYVEFVIASVFRFIGLSALFIIPYFVFKFLGVDIDASYLLVFIAYAAFAQIFSTWVPLPGSSGGAEFAFYQLFINITVISILDNKASVILVGLLIWRILVYYLTLIIGFISTMLLEHGNDTKYKNASSS